MLCQSLVSSAFLPNISIRQVIVRGVILNRISAVQFILMKGGNTDEK